MFKRDELALLRVRLLTTDTDSDGEYEVAALPRETVTYATQEAFVQPPPSWTAGEEGVIQVRVAGLVDSDGDVRVEIPCGTHQILYAMESHLTPLVTVPLDTVDDIEKFLEG